MRPFQIRRSAEVNENAHIKSGIYPLPVSWNGKFNGMIYQTAPIMRGRNTAAKQYKINLELNDLYCLNWFRINPTAGSPCFD